MDLTSQPVDQHLLDTLKQLAVDINDPQRHYMVSANYIDFVDSTRTHTRWYMCPIYIHSDSATNLDFDDQSILLDTFFSPQEGTLSERIRIPYSQIYRVARNSTGGLFIDEDCVYQDSSKLKMPPIPTS